MAINQGGNGGGNPSNGQTKFTSLPPAERVDRLHKALMSDEYYSGIITNDFNAFVEEFSQPERMRELHTALSQDEIFGEFVPSRYEDAIEWMGFTAKPEPMGKPLPTTQNRSGRGGVDSGVGSQSGLQSSSQRRITVDDIGVTGVGGTEPEFNYEVDRQAAEEESESLRQQRINQGVNQINILVNAAGKEGRGLIEKGLFEGLSQREYQKLYDVLEGTQFRDYISEVNPGTDFVSPNAFRQIFADGITAGGSGADYSTATKRGDFDKLSEQANTDAVNQWLSGFDSRMQDKVGERAYRAATDQLTATYGEKKARAIADNAERVNAYQFIPEEERAVAALTRELNDLVGSERELSSEEVAKAANLERQIKAAEVELGKVGTLYDPITGQFIPQMRAPEFAAEVSQKEEEAAKIKDLDLLKQMRRRAYFAYTEYRKKAGDKDFLYDWIPGQDVEVDRMRSAWADFSALNRVIELNIDPATITREGENLDALAAGFTGSPDTDSPGEVAKLVIESFRRSGLTPSKEQEARLEQSFSQQAFTSLGASTNIMIKMAAEMALTRGVRGMLGLNSYTNAFRRVLSATRLGAKAPKAANVTAQILGGAFDVGQSGLIFEGAGQNFATGAGEEIAQKVVDLLTKGKAGRLIKLLSGTLGETFAEYLGELTNEISELGIDNLDEAFRETFGRNPESAMDKLLLTLATIAPFAGISAIGREFTDSVEKYAKSQPASDVQREVLSVIDVLREEAEKKKGGAVAAVGGAATTAAPEVATPETAPEAATKTLEEQKADIERRRQEELKRFEGRRANSIVRFNPDGDNTELTEEEIEEVENLINTAKKKGLNVDRTQKLLQTNGFIHSVGNSATAFREFLKARLSGEIDTRVNGEFLNLINAKYDAELSSLESGQQSTTEQDVETAPATQAAAVTPATPTPTTNPALADVESTAKALSGKTAGLIKEPTIEEVVADLQKGNSAQLTYEKKSDVPLELRDKIVSWGEVGGKKVVSVRLSEIEANYLLNKNNPQAISESYHAAKAKPEADRTAQEVSLIESVENLLRPESGVVSEAPVAETTSGNVQDTGQGQTADTQGTQSEGVAAAKERIRKQAKEEVAKVVDDDSLTEQQKEEKIKQIVDAAKAQMNINENDLVSPSIDFQLPAFSLEVANPFKNALNGLGYSDADISNMTIEEQQEIVINKTQKAEVASSAKVDAVKENARQERIAAMQAELDLETNQETDATKEQGSAPLLVGDRPQVSEEVRGQDTEGGEVTGEGEVKTKEGEPTQEEVDTIASKAGVKPKNLRDLYRINRDLFGQNRIKAFASAIVMDRMIGVMAARAGVTKAEMYGKLEFRKGNFNEILQTPNVVFQGTFNGQNASFITLPEGISIVNGWYSTIEKNLRETKIEKQSVAKWLSGGFIGKGDEAIYTGVKGWLESKNPQEQVSKQEILDWMKDNRVEIVEVVKEEKGTPVYRTLTIIRAEDLANSEFSTPLTELNKEELDVILRDFEENEQLEILNYLSYIESNKEFGSTKFSQYQLEGEKENYKEVLVTLPTRIDKAKAIQLDNGNWKIQYPDGAQSFVEYKSKEFAEKDIQEGVRRKGEFRKEEEFRSTHFDEPNILVHLRMNTRTDADGNKVLFLEEIQSDWGQQGKKEGFTEATPKAEIEAVRKYNSLINEKKKLLETAFDYLVKKNIAELQSKVDAINERIDAAKNELPKNATIDFNTEFANIEVKKSIPIAPFVTDTNAWVKLGLKMALREAVSQGATKIAWTTGEQQNERYSLDKYADEVRYNKNNDGTFNVVAFKDGENISDGKNLNEKQLEERLGKDVAKRIVDGVGEDIEGEKSLTGLNLKMEGTGMKGFYDKIVPDVAKALVRELTGQKVDVGETRIQEGVGYEKKWDNAVRLGFNVVGKSEYKYADEYTNDFVVVGEDGYSISGGKTKQEAIDNFLKYSTLADVEIKKIPTQQSIDVSPALKAQVQKGMPLFQRSMDGAKGAMQTMADGSFIVYAITDPNVSTPLHELAHVFEHYLTDAEKAAVQSWAKTKGWTTETSEAFARGFEKYLADGIAPTAQLQKIFDKFKQWLVDIYNGVVGSEIDIELNDSMRDIYARMIGDTDVAVEAEPVQEGKVAKIIEELRSDPNVTEVHVSGNDIVYVKKDKNGKPRYYEKIGGGRSNQLSKADFEFKREIAMDNATSITEAGIPLEGEPAFLEGEDQTSLNVLDSAPVVTSEGTLPESTEQILEQEESESETLTEQEVDSLFEEGGLRLTAITTMSPEQKKSAKQRADERYEASKKKLKESWKDFSAKARSAGITPTPQSQKAQFDAMLQVFADVAILAKDWALRKALSGADLSKLTYFDFKRENRDIFSDSAARVKVGSRFFDKGEDSYASLAFDQGLAMALDPTHQMETPVEKTGSEILDDILAKGQKQSKNAFNFGDFSSKALAALASAFDYNASLKNSIIDLSNRIKKAGMKSFSVREFFERLQFAAQPGSKIQLKYDQFRRAVYDGLSKEDKKTLDAVILFRSVISLEKAINERRAKIAEFENDLKDNHGFTDKDVSALNKYAAGTKITKEQKAKIEAYLKATNQTKSEFKSKIRSIEGKREANKGIGGEYQHPKGLTLESAQGSLEAVKSVFGQEVYDDLQKRADAYFDFNRSLLLDRLNAGQISQYLYDEIANREYVPRIWDDSELIEEFANNPAYGGYDFGVDSNKGGYIGIKRLKGGSSKTEEAVIESDLLMKINTAMAVQAIENHRLMQFVINELVPTSDAYVNLLIEEAIKKNGGKPISASEERKIRRDSQIVYEIKRTGTAKDGKPKFEPPLDGFVEFVFSDGNTTRAFAALESPGGGNFLSNMRMSKKGLAGSKKAIVAAIKHLMGVSLIKFTAVAANPSFAIAQLVSMDVMHQMMVTPGVKFVPWAFLRRVVLGSSKVAEKAYQRAIFKNRVLFSKLFSKQRPTPELTAFEKQLEDAIAHGLDFSGGILGEKKYSFDDKSKFGENFKKFISFLEERIRDTELATRLTSYETLVARKMKAKKRELKRDLTDDEISEIKRSAAYDISNVLNYYNRGAVSEGCDSFIPFFSAAVNAMKAHARFLPGKLGRIGGGEPMTAKQKAVYLANVGQFIGGSIMLSLYMFAKDEEDERNGIIPAGANGHKDALIIPLWVTEDDNGKRARAFISLPLDKMMGGYNLVGKRLAQDLYYGSEDTWTRGNRPQYPVKSYDILNKFFYETIPGVGSAPPLLSGAYALRANYDLYRTKEIYRSQGGTPDPENMADERTRAIFRVLSRFTKGVVDLPAKQLETAFGKVVSLNNPLANLLTTAFAQILPEDLRGEGETLEGIMKSGTGRLYGVSRRAALEEGETEVSIAVGNIGADMASDQVGMVFDELSRVPANKRAANARVFAAAVSSKASAIKSDNRGFSTSSQVSRLKKSGEVDYELGEEILDAYKARNPSVVNDLMSLPDSYFGESSSFYRSLVGDNNGNAAEVGRIIYARRREQSKDMPTIGSLARGFRERLKGMGIDGADGQALAEALAKLSVESDKRNAKKK
jgi:hypothetical protein